MRSRHVSSLLLVLLGYAAADDVVSLDVATPKAPPPAKPYSSAAEAAVARALRSPNDATSHHDNGTAIERYDFHSELVYVDKKLPHGVKVYRTMNHDKTTRGLPSCATVDGWYLSLGGLPFWPVEFVHKGQPDIAAACDYVFVDWPKGKNIRDEVCVC